MSHHKPYTCKDCEDTDAVLPRTSFFHSRGRPYGRCKVHYAIRKKQTVPRPDASVIPAPILLWCHRCEEPGPAMDFHDGTNYLTHCGGCRSNKLPEKEERYALGPLDIMEQSMFPGIPYKKLTPKQRDAAVTACQKLLGMDQPQRREA